MASLVQPDRADTTPRRAVTAVPRWSAVAALLATACRSSGGAHESSRAQRDDSLVGHAAGARIVVYAGEGKSLVAYALDPETGVLTRRSSVDVAEPVQYG